LSYTRAREIVLPAFESIGLDKKNFGLHRAGGAFAAANAHLLSDRCLKGIWPLDVGKSYKDGYIKDNVESLLSPWVFIVMNTIMIRCA
jgi:hypothetical protein